MKLHEEFTLVNDDVNNICMFSTEKNLQFLTASDFILMDGTFDSCPSLFLQIFVIIGKKNNVHVPLVYFLLPGKTPRGYELALRKLTSFLPATYAPQFVHVDFEQSIHIAMSKVWPSTTIKGCQFHLEQAWFRHLQSLGLAKTYKSKTAEGSYLLLF